MSQPASAPIRILAAEAARLTALYRGYVYDRDFIAMPKEGRIIYFCDAHDIKAYINPDRGGSLDGFRTEAERIATPNADNDLKLRSDQIISGLLFDPECVVGLLPSHGKQMDHEVAYQGDQLLRNNGDLLKRARSEIERIGQTLKGYVLAAHHAGSREQVEAAVKIVRDGAPALVALLRNELDSSAKRLEAVLAESGLTLWDTLDWSDFGTHGDDRPADKAPSISDLTAMQDRLAARPYRRNTDDSNWADASALAHLACLDAEVRLRTGGLTQVRLVSRAWTLLQAAIDLAEEDGSPVLVRHPRLLALRGDEAAQLDGAGQLTLDTALGIYRAHLASLEKAGEADSAGAHAAVSAFVETWDGFEKSRLALEAKPLLTSTSDDHAIFGQLVRIFKSAERPETELNRIFLKSFAKFGESAAGFLLNQSDLRQLARVDHMRSLPRVQITPLTTCAVGPLEIIPWEAMPANGGRVTLDDIAHAVESRSRAERFLIWSIALASAGRWKQAGFFAQAAVQVADLEATAARSDAVVARDKRGQAQADRTARDALEIRNEATLLRVEIRRLGSRSKTDADNDVSDPTRRFTLAARALQGLGEWRPSRVAREEAVQTVEAFLLGAKLPDRPDILRQLAERLERHIAAAKSPMTKARLIAVLLVMHLAAERHTAIWPDRSSTDRGAAQTFHRQLVALLAALRSGGEADGLPHRARALALIGFKLFRKPEPAPGLGARKSLIGVRDVEVPEAMRGDLAFVQRALEEGSDEVAKLLRIEIDSLAASFRLLNSPHLVLAPVRFAAVEERLHALGGDFGRKGDEAYRLANPVLDAFLGAGLEGRHISQLEKCAAAFQELVDAAPKTVSDEWLLFHIRSERLLLSLLAATLKPEHERAQAWVELDEEYKQLSVAFPRASLPYIRRHHIAHVQERVTDAVALLDTALELVDQDPYLGCGPEPSFHWLQSYVRRRLMALKTPQPAVERLGQISSGGVLSQLEGLEAAFRLLMDVERRDRSDTTERAHSTEKERRANNLVVYASRMLERDGGKMLSGLATNTELEALAERLAPNGIGGVIDSKILHTLGCYFAARGRQTDAFNVGRRILAQISKRLDDGVTTASDTSLLTEASEWVQASSNAPVAGSDQFHAPEIRA